MADTTINLSPTAPTATITTPGAYDINIALLTGSPTVTFSGPATFSLNSVAGLLTSYTLVATNGATLAINGLSTLPNAANLVIGAGSTIALGAATGPLTTVAATFSGAGGTLTFATGLLSTLTTIPTITGYAAGDHIDLGTAYAATDSVTYTALTGILLVSNAAGLPIGAVHLVGTYNPAAFSINTAPGGGIEIDLACFLRGTRIRTPEGDREVETLTAGCLVTAADGAALPVVAVRTRTIDLDAPGASAHRPIRFRAGSIAPGVPARDLLVSPDHSMHLDGAFVPASLLVDGESILRAELSGSIDYVHVEVDPHAVLLAEGAETESYLDIGHRGHFARPPGVVALHPTHDPRSWEDACAPLVLTGPALAAIRARLAARLVAWRAEQPPVARVA